MEIDEDYEPRTYTKRWCVLCVISITISLRGFNQSCFGPSNNLLADYFQVEPWQVDWLVVIQSVVFLTSALPLSLLTVRMGYRTLVLSTTLSQSIGFAVTALGLSFRGGFALALCGQAMMGFSNIVSWSLPPPTAAIWFAKHEVASVVATQVVARGVGESLGAFLPTALTNDNSTVQQMESTWKAMYWSLCGVATLICIVAYFVITDRPPRPPSLAQYKADRLRGKKSASSGVVDEIRSSADEFRRVVRVLFRDRVFVCAWVLFGASNPVLRTNNVLLSSAIIHRFGDRVSEVDGKIGSVLSLAWAMYTLGGFVTGPIITYTQRYKSIALVGQMLLFGSCMLVWAGVYALDMGVVYAGVVVQGLMVGWCNTSLFELLAEISYPHPTMFVTMISIICMGVFRFLYPLLGRFLINRVGVAASQLFPCLITLACVVIASLIRPTYRRKFANLKDERKELLNELEGENE